MALIVCYTVLHGKLIFVQSLREIFRSLIRQWHGREENAMTIYIYIYIYIYIHWSPIQYLERCFISYRFKVTHVGLIFFFFNLGCPGQLTRTTINSCAHWTSCKPSEHVRHCGGDRRAQWDFNPGAEERNKSLPPLGYNLKCMLGWSYINYI